MDTPGENVPEAETTTTTTTAVEAATPEGTLPKEETKETGPELTVEEDRGDKDKEQQPIQAQPPTTQTMEPAEVNPTDLPKHGSEVFVGNLPMVSEDQLRAAFSSCGTVLEIRIPVDQKTGERRKYGFILFATPEEANVAKSTMEGQMLEGNTLRVKPSQTKNRLYFGNLDRDLTSAEFENVMKENGKGVEGVELVTGAENKCSGFGFVSYYNHACAQWTKNKLEREGFAIKGTMPRIEFSESKNAVTQDNVRSVYLGGLPESTTEDEIRQKFEGFGAISHIALPLNQQGMRRFGFVHYQSPESAQQAVGALKDACAFNGVQITIELAKRTQRNQEDRKRARMNQGMGMGYGYNPHRRGRYDDRYGPGGGGYGAPPGGGGYGGGPGGYGGGGGGYGGGGGGYGGGGGGYGGGGGGYGGGGPGGYGGAGGGGYGGAQGGYGGGGYGDYTQQGGYAAQAGMQQQQQQQQGGLMNGMSMVPMMLPNGQVGYMMQPKKDGQPSNQQSGPY